MLPILNLGPLAVQTPLLILLIGVWIGIALAEKGAREIGTAGGRYQQYDPGGAGWFPGRRKADFRLSEPGPLPGSSPGDHPSQSNTLALLEGGVLGVVAGIVHAQRNSSLWKPWMSSSLRWQFCWQRQPG